MNMLRSTIDAGAFAIGILCLTLAVSTAGCSTKGGKDSAAIDRLKMYYGPMRSCAIVYRVTASISPRQTRRDTPIGPAVLYRAYFKAPDTIKQSYAGSAVSTLSVGQIVTQAKGMLVDPGMFPLLIVPHLFLDFPMAAQFDTVSTFGAALLAGHRTEVVRMEKKLGPSGVSNLRVTLWIDGVGSLRKYKCESESTSSPGSKLQVSGDLVEERANVALPPNFFENSTGRHDREGTRPASHKNKKQSRAENSGKH